MSEVDGQTLRGGGNLNIAKDVNRDRLTNKNS